MIRRDRENEIEILAPEGARDFREIGAAVQAALDAGARTVVLDLAAVTGVRGDHLDALADVAFRCEKARAAVVLAGLSKEARHAIDILDLGSLFPYVYTDRAEALATLRRARVAPAGETPLEIGFEEEPPPSAPAS